MARVKKCCGKLIRYCRMPNGHWLWMNADGSGRHDCLGPRAAAMSLATRPAPATSAFWRSSNSAGPSFTDTHDPERPWLNFLAILMLLALFFKFITWLWSELVGLLDAVFSYVL